MNDAVGDYFDTFIQEQVASGRYASGEEVIEDGLRLVEERAAEMQAHGKHVQAARAVGGS